MSTPSTLPSPTPSSPNEPPSGSEKKPNYVLDAFALFALLQKEKGAATVTALLMRAEREQVALHLSLINWGEVLYSIEREQGAERFGTWKAKIARLPIQLAHVNQERVERAAHIKSQHRVSYADAFAIGLAQELEAAIVTGDPEFKSIENLISIVWL
ncbi:MAG TPA: type II toxin-antitoxin system VapC family toxin [Anaerolineae bacterium]|nr:type II toxin-antitoxin system VapC family toxin [Anaerolineae bacterium]